MLSTEQQLERTHAFDIYTTAHHYRPAAILQSLLFKHFISTFYFFWLEFWQLIQEVVVILKYFRSSKKCFGKYSLYQSEVFAPVMS